MFLDQKYDQYYRWFQFYRWFLELLILFIILHYQIWGLLYQLSYHFHLFDQLISLHWLLVHIFSNKMSSLEITVRIQSIIFLCSLCCIITLVAPSSTNLAIILHSDSKYYTQLFISSYILILSLRNIIIPLSVEFNNQHPLW